MRCLIGWRPGNPLGTVRAGCYRMCNCNYIFCAATAGAGPAGCGNSSSFRRILALSFPSSLLFRVFPSFPVPSSSTRLGASALVPDSRTREPRIGAKRAWHARNSKQQCCMGPQSQRSIIRGERCSGPLVSDRSSRLSILMKRGTRRIQYIDAFNELSLSDIQIDIYIEKLEYTN